MTTENILKIVANKNEQECLKALEHVEVLSKDLVNENGQTLLHLAVLNNQLGLASVLLNKGFDPNAQDNNKLSPFIASAANGLSEMFNLLLQYSPDLTLVNRFGGTSLLPSSEKGFIRVVQPALDAGVPVNHANRLGWTALLEAVVLGNQGYLFRDIAEELMSHGADPLILDFDGKSAIDYAKEKKNQTLLDILEEREKEDLFKEIKELIRKNQFYESIRLLLALPVSSEQIYYLGFTYEVMGEFDLAHYYYELGARLDNQFYYYLGNLSKKRNQVEHALAYYEKGAENTAEAVFFEYHRSNYLREIGQHEEAVRVMDSLLKKDPQRVDYLFHKSNSLKTLGKQKEAIEVMKQASHYQPGNSLFKEHSTSV